MEGAPATGAGLCSKCGHALSGPFCANCGTPAAPHTDNWSAVASEFWDPGASRNHFETALAFLRAPVRTILSLTEDSTYRSHWSFLSLCLGLQLTLAFAVLPKLLGSYYPVPGLADKSAVLTGQLVQYTGIIILTPIQYYVCRLLGSIRRSPASYVKLCVLSVSFCTLVSLLVVLTFWGLGSASTAMSTPVDPALSGNVLTGLSQLAIVIFVAIVHKHFWGMTWPRAILATLAFAVLSWMVVYPLLMQFVSNSGLGKFLDDILP